LELLHSDAGTPSPARQTTQEKQVVRNPPVKTGEEKASAVEKLFLIVDKLLVMMSRVPLRALNLSVSIC
jgi:hypothetical protein